MLNKDDLGFKMHGIDINKMKGNIRERKLPILLETLLKHQNDITKLKVLKIHIIL